MSKLPSISGEDAISAFEFLGYSVVRISSSHNIMAKPGEARRLSVPVHRGKDVKRGTLRSLIRDAGITVSQFVAALGGEELIEVEPEGEETSAADAEG